MKARMMKDEIFICLDCESTGLEPKTDRIIEVAVVRFTLEKILDSYETLINPECIIPASSQEIHNISQEMVQNQPKIQEVLPKILEMIDGHILVGHGIQFDIEILYQEAKRHCIPTGIDKQPFLDTLRMARLYGESPVNSLQYLREHFNIKPEGAHRAMSDVLVNVEVFKQLAKAYSTVDSLMTRLKKPIRLKTMPLGKHKGRKFEEIPIEYLRWAERKDFDQDLLYSIRLELKNRKKGGRFGLSSNPFADL